MRSTSEYFSSTRGSSSLSSSQQKSTYGSVCSSTKESILSNLTINNKSSSECLSQTTLHGTLHIWVGRAVGLRKTHFDGGTIGPYLNIETGGNRMKTKVHRKRRRDPIWNENFVFRIAPRDFLDNQDVLFQVKNKRLALASRVIGETKLSIFDVLPNNGQMCIPLYSSLNTLERTGEVEIKTYFQADEDNDSTKYWDPKEGTNTVKVKEQSIEETKLKWPNNIMEEDDDQIRHFQLVLHKFYQSDNESTAESENSLDDNDLKKSQGDKYSVLTQTAPSLPIATKDPDYEEEISRLSSGGRDSIMPVPLEEVFIFPDAPTNQGSSSFDFSACLISDDDDDDDDQEEEEENWDQSTIPSYPENSEKARCQHEMNVNHIVSIGFSIEAAERALQKAKNDAKLAVRLLMNGEVPLNVICAANQWEENGSYDSFKESSVGLNYYGGLEQRGDLSYADRIEI